MCLNLIFRGSVADLQFDLFVLYFSKSVTVIEFNQAVPGQNLCYAFAFSQ